MPNSEYKCRRAVSGCTPLTPLLFYRRLLCSDNIVLRTLAGLIRFEMLGIADKYDTKSIYFSTATVKNAVWSSFVNVVKF